MERDPELQSLIRRWTPPPASANLNGQMMSRYRRMRGSSGLWRRFLHARLSVPVPALAALLLLIACFILLSLRSVQRPGGPMDGFEPVANPKLIVERAEAAQ